MPALGLEMDAGWYELSEQAIAESAVGHDTAAMRIWREALTRSDIPDIEWNRLTTHRNLVATRLLAASALHVPPESDRPTPQNHAEVTVTLSATQDTGATERTLNSFLNCCTDSHRVGRFLLIDSGLSLMDRVRLAETYPFLDFLTVPAEFDLNVVREDVTGHYWLHLWHGWRFFIQENLITRLTDVLESEPQLLQVGINFGDALHLDNDSPARSGVRLTPRGNRYVLSDSPTTGPAMFDMKRLNLALEKDRELKGPAATLDEVLCVQAP